MKRFLMVSILIILLLLSACNISTAPSSIPSAAGESILSPSPSPTPASPRVIAVFGADDHAAFLQGVQSAAKEAGAEIEILPVKGGISALSSYQPVGESAAIVFLSDAAHQLPATTFPLYAFAAEGQSVSGGTAYLGFDDAQAEEIALQEALRYPPHLAPVRMLGLFTSQSSTAYALWSGAKSMGQVFAKNEFFEDAAEVALADWLNDACAAYFPGMLDAIFAETGALAVSAAEVLASLGRDDIEVFCAGDDEAIEKLSPILLCVVGANQLNAGARCYTEAAKLLSGEPAQSGILLPEALWYTPPEQ